MQRRVRTRTSILAILALSLVSLACFAFPLYVIWPFRYQSPGELSLALAVRRIAPWVSTVCAAFSLLLVVFLWQGRRTSTRILAVSLCALSVLGCFLSQLNIYELMFHPISSVQFDPVPSARLDPDDMLITVRVNGRSRGYAIREMAYHHVINDTLAGQPIVATY